MDILTLLGIENGIRKAGKEKPAERYARLVFDLGAAEYVGTDIEIKIDGDYLAKIKYDGTATGCYFKFDDKRSSKIYVSEFRKRHTPFSDFKRIYLSNPTAQTGKEFVIFVGGAFAGEIEPSTGDKVGVTDADGADMNPAKEDGELATIRADIALIKGIQAIDGGGDLQKIKEELEKILLDTAGIEGLQAIDGGGELQKIKEELEKILLDTADIQTAIELLDNALDTAGEDSLRALPPEMLTDVLAATTSGATDTIGAPGEGIHIEVLGFILNVGGETLVMSSRPTLKFATSSITLWEGGNAGEGHATMYKDVVISGIRVKGGANEALTLTNFGITGGAGKIYATIYYRLVTA